VLQPDRSRRAVGVDGSSPNSRKIMACRGRRSHLQERDAMHTDDCPQVQPPTFAGLDVAKDKLNLHLWPLGLDASFENTPAGIDALIQQLARQQVGCGKRSAPHHELASTFSVDWTPVLQTWCRSLRSLHPTFRMRCRAHCILLAMASC